MTLADIIIIHRFGFLYQNRTRKSSLPVAKQAIVGECTKARTGPLWPSGSRRLRSAVRASHEHSEQDFSSGNMTGNEVDENANESP